LIYYPPSPYTPLPVANPTQILILLLNIQYSIPMTLLERITDGLTKVLPAKQQPSTSMSGAIGGGGHGMVPFEDDVSPGTPILSFLPLHSTLPSHTFKNQPKWLSPLIPWTRLRNPCSSCQACMAEDGQLGFLLFVPLLWVIWLWVHHVHSTPSRLPY
jgi:hypothetical protein